jgi:NAD(P)-dependent dehydrogenase (short-subunit alcohol dehydrogenase family)
MQSDRFFDVADELVAITGVSGQLGLQYAKTFLGRGARVIGLDKVESAGARELSRENPTRLLNVTADVTDRQSLAGALAIGTEKFGKAPTVLINNAAIDAPPSAPIEENGPFESYPEQSWDLVMEVNLKGVFLACQVFGAAMAAAGKGSIINIASIYGMVSPDQSIYDYRRARGETFFKPVAYSASKSGILNLTRYLAVYWAKKYVRVNSLSIAGVFNGQEREFIDAYCGRIPVGRMADKDEYNGAVVFLASAASSYMTGANLVVDGGWTAI